MDDSLWFITKEGIFNLVFYLGMFTFVFRALNKAPQKIREINFSKKYPRNKLNKDYFLGQYEGRNEIFVFELENEKRKLWIANPQTRRCFWEHDDVIPLNSTTKFVVIAGKSFNLAQYPESTKYDGKIDILNPEKKDNTILFTISISIIVISLILLKLLARLG